MYFTFSLVLDKSNSFVLFAKTLYIFEYIYQSYPGFFQDKQNSPCQKCEKTNKFLLYVAKRRISS